jgi:5'-nucleotidase
MADAITIIHTNDTHGRMKPPVSERLRALRDAHPGALLLDAGDSVSAGNLGFRVGGEPVLETMSELGYAAMCLGNRETHPRKEVFPLKVDRASFPLLSANMVAKSTAPPVVPHVVLTHGAVRIGVFGVTVQMFRKKQWSQALCDYWFEEPLEAARRQAALLRPQVDVLIALTHIGFRQDQALAALCPELDLLIGGHSHTDLYAPVWVGEVPVLQARSHGFYAGIARLEPAAGRWRLTSWEKHPLRDDPPASEPAPGAR